MTVGDRLPEFALEALRGGPLDEIEEDCHRLVEQRGRYLREVFRIRSEANEVRSDLARMALRIDAYMYDHGEAERESDRYARGSPLHSRVSIL